MAFDKLFGSGTGPDFLEASQVEKLPDWNKVSIVVVKQKETATGNNYIWMMFRERHGKWVCGHSFWGTDSLLPLTRLYNISEDIDIEGLRKSLLGHTLYISLGTRTSRKDGKTYVKVDGFRLDDSPNYRKDKDEPSVSPTRVELFEEDTPF